MALRFNHKTVCFAEIPHHTKIKFCLFVLYLPTHNLPPYSKTYCAVSRRKNIFRFFMVEMYGSLHGLGFLNIQLLVYRLVFLFLFIFFVYEFENVPRRSGFQRCAR